MGVVIPVSDHEQPDALADAGASKGEGAEAGERSFTRQVYPFAGVVANEIREIEHELSRGEYEQAETKARELRQEYERAAWGRSKEEQQRSNLGSEHSQEGQQ